MANDHLPPTSRVPWAIIEGTIEYLWCEPLSEVDNISHRRDAKRSQLIGDIGLIWEQDPRLKAAIPDATLDRDNAERWRLHRRISLVSKDWRALIRRLSVRFVMIEHFNDWAAYCELDNSSTSDSGQTLITASNEPQHLRYHASPLRWPPGHRWLTSCKQIVKLVPRCTSAEVIVTELDRDMVWIHKDWHRILRPLAELGTMKNLHVILPPIQDARCSATLMAATEIMPFSQAASVTYCRFANLPACVCPEEVAARRSRCFIHTFLCWMPNLKHLHVETPYIFRSSFYKLKLRSLSVDAPSPSPKPESSEELLAEYNLGAGIRKGLLKCPPGGRHRILTICTSREKLPGWVSFEEFCDSYGITLQHDQVFWRVERELDAHG